ncbi:MAG: DUF4864 domain-containing protein [Rhodobacteraceae bacterium]|nr:DUF4864 domain-containing protein [Paracoccaceae bacterium]
MLRALVVVAAVLAALPARADDGVAIRDVINNQIAAFGTGDLTGAFAFASPTIRGLFVTPENFGRMVESGYPMIWRPSKVDFLDLREEDGRILQRLSVRDKAGREFQFDYEMTLGPDGWRINGVYPVPMPDVGV